MKKLVEGETVAYMYQHEDTGEIGFVDQQQLEWGFEKNNPRLQVIGPLYAAPPAAQSATEMNSVILPDFLIEMSKQMNTQGNLVTANPIWQVRCKRYLPTEPGCNESHIEIHAPDSEGIPVFSSKEGFINDDAIEEIWDAETEWCTYWCGEQGYEISEESKEYFFDSFNFSEILDDYDLPEDWRIIHMQEHEEVVKTCLTEADANFFIKRKQHDYPQLYTYVESMNYCPQMIELSDWIKSLTKPPEQPE